MREVLSRGNRGAVLFACCASLAIAGSLGVCAISSRVCAQAANPSPQRKNVARPATPAPDSKAAKDLKHPGADATADKANPATAQPAARDYKLGLMQLESDAILRDDKVAPVLMDELRQALSKRREFDTVDTHVTLAQLSLAEDCNTTEPSCLSRIAEKMKLDGFVFGKLTHVAGEAPMASFRRYDRRAESIQSSALVSFGTGPLTETRVRAEAEELVRKLFGADAPTLAAAGSAANASTDPAGAGAAAHATRPGRTGSAADEPGQLAGSADELDGGGLNMRKFAGYMLLGGAAASVGLSVLSFVQVDRASNNASFQQYRSAVGMSNADVKDVCDEARADQRYNFGAADFRQVKNSCSTGTTFEILQYVFIGSALVTGGLATFFLFGGDDSADTPKSERAYITLHPSIGRGGGSLSARMHF